MDDTHKSRAADETTTRKRRSSILKSQRPPRTPFSELEFNVATPTDTTKSRRVSFSRRTGVAEFARNEATTTWENFYEQQNKSLESSGNESDLNPPRQSIGHIGKRIFDLQFEEVEAIGFMGTTNNPTALIDNSMNPNFTQQIASLENTHDDGKLPVPVNNFELSASTDHHSKLFKDELTLPTVGVSGRINVDFSMVKPLSESDDLTEIEKDLARVQSNGGCPGPFNRDVSEYIEIDLNCTHVASNDLEMSLTDTISTAKVENIAKNDKKSEVGKDWTVDKENIAINPCLIARETTNCAPEIEDENVLVFDGKRLTLQSEKPENYRQTFLPNAIIAETPQRKTIVLNIDDALPNFTNDLQISKLANKTTEKTAIFNDDQSANISMTQPVRNVIIANEKPNNTVLYQTETDISITQAVPSNIVERQVKRQTIVYEDDTGDVSITQAVKSNLIAEGKPEKRRTIFFEEDGNVSMTQVIPATIIAQTASEKRKTILFEDDACEVSLTRPLPANILEAKNSVLNDSIDISITSAVPGKIFQSEKRKTVVFDDENGDISVTQAVPNRIIENQKRRTIVYNEEDGDISMTQAIPNNVLLLQESIKLKNESIVEPVPVKLAEEIQLLKKKTSPNRIIENQKRRTIVYNEEDGDITMTQAIPNNVLLLQESMKLKNESVVEPLYVKVAKEIPSPKKNSTIVKDEYDIENNMDKTEFIKDRTKMDCSFDISLTEAIDAKVLIENISKIQNRNEKEMTLKSFNADMSITCPVPSRDKENRKTIVFEADNDMSITKPISQINEIVTEKRKTIIFDEDLGNLSITKPIPAMLLALHKENLESEKSMKVLENFDDLSPVVEDVNLYQAVTEVVEKQSKIEQGDAKTNITQSFDMLDGEKKQLEVSKSELSRKSLGESKVAAKSSTKTEKSILHDLLDMSTESTEIIEPKNKIDATYHDEEVVVAINSNLEFTTKEELKNISSGSLFYVTKGSDEVIDLDKNEGIEEDLIKEKLRQIDEHNPSLENNEKRESIIEEEIKEQLRDMTIPDYDIKEDRPSVGNITKQDRLSVTNITKTDRSTIGNITKIDRSSIRNLTKIDNRKSIRNADDTNDLIQLLSDHIDKSAAAERQIKNETVKNEINDTRRLSFLPKIQSMNKESSNSMAPTIDNEADTTLDLPQEKKTIRHSKEVTKTLNFEDDSFSEMQCDPISPLKKSVVAETTLVKDAKGKVIPNYLNVSEDVKELMHDLVKPTADMIPIVLDKSLARSQSTTSAQIQANLMASSQIDVNNELYSGCTSICDIQERAIDTNKSISRVMSSPIKEPIIEVQKTPIKEQTVPGKVLLFDHSNPLNNVLLVPSEITEAHKYNPIKSEVSLCVSERTNSAQISIHETNFEVERVSVQYNIDNHNHIVKQSGDASQIVDKTMSIVSKPSVNQSTDTIATEMMTTEVNTDIAMKENKELLKASSSLTLVEDCKDITDTESLVTTDLSSIESKCKKRVYSPAKANKNGTIEVTPKPLNKMQKKSPKKNNKKSPKKPTTVQHLCIDNRMASDVSKCSIDTVHNVTTTQSSTSDGKSSEAYEGSTKSSCLRVDLYPDLLSDVSSKNLVECESSYNVVSKIEMLPFIGSAAECIWDTSSSDVWTFLLLYSRIRLTVKLCHTIHNSTRTRVRADTRIEALRVEVLHHDKRNTVASACVRFASETMRYFINRGCSVAGEIPSLLRRCCGVSRVALKWGRAMHDAKARLAYTLTDDGRLTLKVANVPLRSVWELTLRMELVVGDAREVPWPRATDVHLRAVVADCCPDVARIAARVSPDWGHVPRTIWRIFKHLKNKTRDPEVLGI